MIFIGGSSLINMAIGLLTTPVITRLVVPESFGQLSIFTMYTNLAVMILCLGMDQTLVRFYYEKNDENGIFIEPLDVSNIASVIDSVPYELKVNNDIFDIRKYEKSFSAFFRRCGVGINENCTN